MKRIILLLVLSLSFSSCTERYHILYDAIHYDFKSIKSYEELYQLYKKWGFWEAGTYYVQSFKYGTFWTEVFCTVDYDFLKQRLYIGFDRTQSRPISENLKNKITSTLVKKYGAYHLNEIEVARYVEGEGWVLYKDMLPCWNLKDRLLYLDLRDLDERHEFSFGLIIIFL
ncbi:hypothetical protein E4O00_01475 [Treponema sp. OMZ 788]|uniref:hypothetical protein n=1 Tax=unclassified Treponema TaxID=2638727 RepID=UPI0020A5B381|nr:MULTISPECIES: hypothetical protein [unclassified Treponema]UTC62093.1 hypothetical protein E4O05_11325 [Treponema sp. OMZ 787]UTC64916.1 hypothetical protein E4O00_01475 [Treponema sp. OMZ 788]